MPGVHLHRAGEAHPSAEFSEPPTLRPQLPAPRRPRHFPCNSSRLGPTVTEEEEADEEQVQLQRSHSSARRGRAGGQLGLALSFSSSARGALRLSRGPRRLAHQLSVRRSRGPAGSGASALRSHRHKWPVSSRLGKPGSSAASPLGADPSPLPASPAHGFLPAPPTAGERASEGPVTEGLLSLALGRGEGGETGHN